MDSNHSPTTTPRHDHATPDRTNVSSRLGDGTLVALFAGMLTVAVGAGTYFANGQIDTERRVSVIEQTRLTTNDAREFMEKLSKLELAIARLPTEPTPPWLTAQLNRLESHVNTLSGKVDTLMERRPARDEQHPIDRQTHHP